jgi:lysophospholipid acyltransferase (LPLAT)-like uncharacterized protein
MKLRNPWLIGLLGLLGALLIRLWMRTVRFRLVMAGETVHPVDHREKRFIYAFWHESILAPTIFKLKIHVLISQHADGELIAQVCRHLGFGVVRGSSTRGGGPALLELLNATRRTHLMVTPDGPKGPRRQIALGMIFAASNTGLPIVPVGVGFASAWRMRSWDRFAIPHPWSTVMCVSGPPIRVPAHLDRNGLQRYRRLVEEEFLKATEAAEEWARTGVRTKPEVLWPEEYLSRKSA